MGPKLEEAVLRRLEMRSGVGKRTKKFTEEGLTVLLGDRKELEVVGKRAGGGCAVDWQGLGVCEEVSQHAKMSSRGSL